MGPRSPDDSGTDPQTPGEVEADQSSPDRTIEGEVTRVESVSYLEGASGHAVASLGFLLIAGVAVRLGAPGVGVVVLIVAYGVALHGLSIYAWDALRASVRSALKRDDNDERRTTRTLTPHTVSTEMKAEMVTGLAMTGGFLACLAVVVAVVRTSSFQVVATLSVGVLAIGNIVALWWMYRSS